MFFMLFVANSEAAVWVKLHEKKSEILMLDKQSVLEKDALKRAWVKITYASPQINDQVADKTYNLSKLLWFFDCPAQKAATSQVFQYSNEELIYSAAVDAKLAKFIEPVPETDVDIAMRYVCEVGKVKPIQAEGADIKPKSSQEGLDNQVKDAEKSSVKDKSVTSKEVANEKSADKNAKKVQAVELKSTETKKNGKSEVKVTDQSKGAVTSKTPTKQDKGNKQWAYDGESGPQHWGKMKPEFLLCETGKNQSPINIDKTIKTGLKSIKALQKFPAKDVMNTENTVRVNFKDGNMMVLEDAPYQLKYLTFHSPSEHTVHGKSYPLEAQFVHANAKNEIVIMSVIYEEGKGNVALDRIWSQIPKELDKQDHLKTRVLPSELIPQSKGYYRFSGSLTMPPCSEGVQWVLMKTPMTVSKNQIEQFTEIVRGHNNRPVQALNGRMVLE